jgi:hypothetical protein
MNSTVDVLLVIVADQYMTNRNSSSRHAVIELTQAGS